MNNWYNTGVTVELNDLIENGVKIFDFEYPIPAQSVTYNGKTAPVPFNKAEFEKRILDHYRFRQIGQETVGRWLHYFRTRIREIMPYYCQLYEFEAKWRNVDDPLESYNLRETFDQETTGTGSQETMSIGKDSRSIDNTTKFSDTPQGSVANIDAYMTNVTTNNGTDTDNTQNQTTQDTSDTGTTRHTLERRGNIGVQPLGSEVRDIREAFINIDQMVIRELNDLFLGVY